MSHPPRSSIGAFVAGACLVAFATTATRAQRADSSSDSTRHTPSDSAAVHARTTLPTIRVVAAPPKRADAATSTVILPEALRTTPANDAWDIVRQTAGVEVHLQGQGPGFASDAVIRGFTSDHSVDVASFIDGVPLNEPVSGHAEGYADWNALIPEAVRKVVITDGPASAWAGNWAMGGMMDVLTESSRLGTEWSARVGSYGDARLSLLTGSDGPERGWLFAADAQRSDGWRDNSQEAIGHLMWNGVWREAQGHTFTLGVGGYGGQWHSPGFITTGAFDSGNVKQAANPTDGGNEGFGTARGAFSRPMGSGTFESSLYVHGGTWHIFLTIPPEGGIGEGSPSQTEELDQRVGLGGVTKYSWRSGATQISAGLDYRAVSAVYQRYYTTDRSRDSIFYFADSIPANLDARYIDVAPVADVQWEITPALSIGFGGRVDWISYRSQQREGGAISTADRVIATPKVSALYRFTEALSAYASFNGGFRSSDGVIATPNLPPALEYASEIGVRYSGRHAEGALAFFLINVSNQQTVNPVTLLPDSSGTTRQQGVEMSGRVALARWLSLFAQAVVNDAHYVRLMADTVNLAGVPVYQVAKSVVQGGFDVQEGLIEGSLWMTYTGAWTPVNQPNVRTSPYTLVNLRAAFPISGPWSGVIGVRNLFDAKYVEVQASGYVSPGQPLGILLTVRHGF